MITEWSRTLPQAPAVHSARAVAAENEAAFQRTGRRKKAFVHTYGCQQNVSDSEKINGMLEAMGYELTGDVFEADVVIYNTCAVREHAEQRVFGNVGALKNCKRQKPSMVIGLCGCMMQQQHVVEKIKKSFPFVDLVFGTHALARFPELLYAALHESGRVIDTGGEDGIVEGLPVRRDGGVKAFVSVMVGCNNFCSYCIVPYVRGRERSRSPRLILEETRRLVEQGYKDITLLGQNVNSYGKDLEGDGREWNFSRLLREINALDGDFRIRFMTSHPKDATDELFHAMAECKKVSRHLHLPFQSGSSRILKAMNRGYTREQYLALARKAREMVPGLGLTSDIIVGFPGETYEDFCQTLDVVRQVGFLNLFTFIYSRREGTPAAKMDDPVPHEEKTRWFARLLDTQEEIVGSLLRERVGSVARVLVEGESRSGDGYLAGRTDDSLIVDFKGPCGLIGKFVNVRVTRPLKFMLLGELVQDAVSL